LALSQPQINSASNFEQADAACLQYLLASGHSPNANFRDTARLENLTKYAFRDFSSDFSCRQYRQIVTGLMMSRFRQREENGVCTRNPFGRGARFRESARL
jgi:hypothetical protein